MIALDADVLVELLRGNPLIVQRASEFPQDEQNLPLVVEEEIVRARLNGIRQAEAGRIRITLPRAYELFDRSLTELRYFPKLPFTPDAESLFHGFRNRKVRVPTRDLRIASICIAHQIKLASRNRRDFDLVPGLEVEYWT